jgi:DNA-binding MarR family transcriptional regulator
MTRRKTLQAAPTPGELAFRALIRTYGLIKRAMEPYFLQYGVSGSQWGVLRALQRAQDQGVEALGLGDLGDRLLIRPASVTGVIDRLERAALVARSASRTDLRAKYVSLTPAGRDLMARVLKDHPAKMESLLAGLNPDQQGALEKLLTQLGSHLESHLKIMATQQKEVGQSITAAGSEV